MFAALTVLAISLPSCQDDETAWERFNASDDAVAVEVTAADELADATADLHSNTGSVVIGTVTVTPGGGPVGTEHTVLVEVLDEYRDAVGRVRLDADAGERGVERLELVQDLAEPGLWVLSLTSVGTEGEQRSDRFGVALMREIDAEDAPDTAIVD